MKSLLILSFLCLMTCNRLRFGSSSIAKPDPVTQQEQYQATGFLNYQMFFNSLYRVAQAWPGYVSQVASQQNYDLIRQKIPGFPYTNYASTLLIKKKLNSIYWTDYWREKAKQIYMSRFLFNVLREDALNGAYNMNNNFVNLITFLYPSADFDRTLNTIGIFINNNGDYNYDIFTIYQKFYTHIGDYYYYLTNMSAANGLEFQQVGNSYEFSREPALTLSHFNAIYNFAHMIELKVACELFGIIVQLPY